MRAQAKLCRRPRRRRHSRGCPAGRPCSKKVDKRVASALPLQASSCIDPHNSGGGGGWRRGGGGQRAVGARRGSGSWQRGGGEVAGAEPHLTTGRETYASRRGTRLRGVAGRTEERKERRRQSRAHSRPIIKRPCYDNVIS